MPSLAKTPEELTASNLALNTISGVGMFAGPAIAGLVLAFSGPSLVFALTGAAYAWSGLCVLGSSRTNHPRRTVTADRVSAGRGLPRDRRDRRCF